MLCPHAFDILGAAPPPRGDADATRIIEAERLIARSSFMETNGPGRPFTMINRRQFVCAGAAGAAFLAGLPKALAATYDLIIKGGRVIDPSVGLDAVRDVAIATGRIAAVEPNIEAGHRGEGGGNLVGHSFREERLPPVAVLQRQHGNARAG